MVTRRIVPILGAAALLCALGAAHAGDAPGLAPMPAPPTPKPEQASLGKMLFFDPRLSGDGSLSCSQCHDPAKGFTDGKPLADAYPGALHFRNALSVVNVAHRKALYWDGRITDPADLVRDHITDAQFMNADGRLVIERLRQVPEYENGFKKAFGGEPTFGRILNAVVAYMQTLNSKGNALDRYLAGNANALTPDARRGLDLFTGKAGCARCHFGPLLTDEKFHHLGVPENPEVFSQPLRHITFRRFFKVLGTPGYHALREDVGLYAVTKRDEDRGKFRTPSLREVGQRSAFMHNGALKTLEDVVAFYNGGGGNAPNKDPLLAPLGLTRDEQRALATLLRTLQSKGLRTQPPASPPYQVRALGKN